ncbi:hypothetical protein Igag_0621 [Ignisphaera aggregans DSM 17230]|uniref:Uncharacterized protein n=1 Tax=Ignisphaera aggregans (strain DSM 17230 / JCM 13409 / AQ1.S1) TaxID=583356 RepID=E0SSI3_IGNAA|nr:hypothetical protein Igag_0621 [Ignisphaera aggregans DSM 17230]
MILFERGYRCIGVRWKNIDCYVCELRFWILLNGVREFVISEDVY